jgi:hypothetical protein
MSGCQYAVENDAEVGPVRCGDTADYEAVGWGWGTGRDGMTLCAEHAWHAIDDGADVTGPMGHTCFLDEDGEIYERQR